MNAINNFAQSAERAAQNRQGSILARMVSLRDDHVYNRSLFANSNFELIIEDNVSSPLHEILIGHLKCVKVSSDSYVLSVDCYIDDFLFRLS